MSYERKYSNSDLALMIFAVPFLILWLAWVVTRLWGWFVVPLGAPQIGMAHAYGLIICVRLALPNWLAQRSMHGEIRKGIVRGFLTPLVYFGAGWAAHWWMVR